MMPQKKLQKFYKYIRGFLILSMILNIIILVYYQVNAESKCETAIEEDLSFRLQLIFVGVVTLIATFLPSYLENQVKIQFPEVLQMIIIIFIIAAGILSQQLNLFVRFFWWDDVLHFVSGTFIAIAGFLLIYILNIRYSFNMNPWLIAIFTFSFSVSIAVFWEIGEFFSDSIFATNYQKWDVPADTPLLGKSYQGLALRDTMADLVIASIGAFIVATYAFFAVKNRQDEVVEDMKKMLENFPGSENFKATENDADTTTDGAV